jgi:hypothetical protein
MASNFSTIGLRIGSEDDYRALDARALAHGDQTRRTVTAAGTYMPWVMGSGVELWTYVDPGGSSLGFVPHFAAQARMAVRLQSRVSRPAMEGSLDGGFYLWVLDDGDRSAELYPLVVDVPDFRAFDDLVLPIETTIAVACLPGR